MDLLNTEARALHVDGHGQVLLQLLFVRVHGQVYAVEARVGPAEVAVTQKKGYRYCDSYGGRAAAEAMGRKAQRRRMGKNTDRLCI